MKLMTVDDLFNFCQSQNFTHFNSNETGKTIHVQIPLQFSKLESDDTTLYCDVKFIHDGVNRNKSLLTDKAMKHCSDTLAYKPVLANFTDVNGEWDFTSHDFEEVENEDGEKETIYYEKQVGCFTADKPYIEYDEEYQHNYLYAKIAIPREYTKAAEIIERKNGSKISAELEILDMSYNAKEKALSFNDAIVLGGTLLGTDPDTGKEVGEGMIDAHVSLQSFSEENAIFTKELINELKKFNSNFEALNINKQGGQKNVDKFNELLLKYNITAEEVNFEYENLSDEELEAKFAEAFENEDAEEPEVDPEDNGENDAKGEAEGSEAEENSEESEEDGDDTSENSEDDEDGSDEADNAEGTEANETQTYSLTLPDGTVKTFSSLSLSDINNALFNLVNETYSELDNDLYFCEVFPDESKLVMMGWSGNNYRQSYKRRKNEFSLEGERIPVKSCWLSEDEEKQLENMKANYSVMESKLQNYETEPEKVELINSEDYAQIRETKEFAEISKRENYFEMSKEDLAKKLDETLLSFAKHNKVTFSSEEKPKTKTVGIVRFGTAKTSTGRGRYGGVFKKED